MTHRTSPGGSLRIDRRFDGVRIAIASGTNDQRRFQAYNALLTELHEDGRLEILHAIKNRSFSLREVYQAHRSGKLPYLASELVVRRPLWETVAKWIPNSATAPLTRARYAQSFRSLERTKVLAPKATFQDLRWVNWMELQKRWRGGPADWNRLRSAVSRCLTVTLGDKYHPFRRSVMAAFPAAKEPTGRVPDLNPDLFWRITLRTPEHVRAVYVTLAVTGIRIGEYLRLTDTDLMPHTLAMRVPGTKTAGSDAVVKVGEAAWPWIRRAVPAPLGYKWIYKHWKRACASAGVPNLTLHDLRHFYGQQLTNAGRTEASVQASLRHADVGMTRRYTKQRDQGENARAMDEILFNNVSDRLVRGA